MLRQFTPAVCLLAIVVTTHAQQEQQPIGSVATRDAQVTGGLQVQGEQAKLITSASVTAYNRTAPIELARGGNVLVCSTSRFHLQRSGNESSLVFGLDRGAIEIHSDSQPQDVVMTPDLRITFASAGPLDLRLRVTPNGDTCVDNTGKSAPQISVSDAFSDSSYRIAPGQHVLFEHGSLKEVVDQEQSPCGCPAEIPQTQLAQGNAPAATDAAARNTFPAAVSQGLAPETKPVTTPTAPSSEAQTEAGTTLAYSNKPEEPVPPAIPPAPPAAATTTTSAPPPAPPGASDIVHAIGRFFHKLFHGSSQAPQSKPAASN